MDGIVPFKEDHKTVKRLFREFEKSHKTATSAAKRELVDQILHELTTHAMQKTDYVDAGETGHHRRRHAHPGRQHRPPGPPVAPQPVPRRRITGEWR